MIDLLKAVILGIVEGLTEFLPISSTGHLIIINQWISFDPEFTKMFDVVIQLGAILAVMVYFWEKLFPFGKGQSREERGKILELWKKVLIGVVPALVLGAAFDDYIETHLFNPQVVAGALIIGGLALLYLENRSRSSSINSFGELSYATAFWIGMIQCLAMIPGTSRSAATIIGAMLLGASRLLAAEFSFFLALPTMVAASGYSLWKQGLALTGSQLGILAVGFITAFLVAWLVVAAFMKFIARHNFKLFAYYRIILGGIILSLLII